MKTTLRLRLNNEDHDQILTTIHARGESMSAAMQASMKAILEGRTPLKVGKKANKNTTFVCDPATAEAFKALAKGNDISLDDALRQAALNILE